MGTGFVICKESFKFYKDWTNISSKNQIGNSLVVWSCVGVWGWVCTCLGSLSFKFGKDWTPLNLKMQIGNGVVVGLWL